MFQKKKPFGLWHRHSYTECSKNLKQTPYICIIIKVEDLYSVFIFIYTGTLCGGRRTTRVIYKYNINILTGRLNLKIEFANCIITAYKCIFEYV